MKYIAKENCFFDTGTEVKIIRTMYNDLNEPLYVCTGKWSMYLLGIKEPEIKHTTSLCLPLELEEIND